ncbi:NAD(P)H-quinone oxidoreductase [Membranihabitans marinus]|uniref:NAD(P)H-quinone oxidoreductase n=1 Tax=Membranihabitans marinus TaxID=1227546 RepID=UPI001F41F987|nr:NAD(P)H-quinone oxidoreductase [Membranihabitans marinus]
MKYISVSQSDQSLSIEKCPKPKLKPEQVLVEVRAFGINRADILQRAGKYPPPVGASPIMGLECSGVIVALGSEVVHWQIGDEVMGLVDGGGYAEFCAMDGGMIWQKPQYLSFEEAAAIPEVFLTAYQALYALSSIQSGHKLLIHAAASSVGQALLQLAEAQGGITTFGTASAGKVLFCRDLGYHHVINYQEEDFQVVVEEITSGQGVDIIIDFVGSDYFVKNINSLAVDGTLILLGVLSGVKVDGFSLWPLLSKRLKIQGSTLRGRSTDYKRQLIADFLEKFSPHLNRSVLKPHIYAIYPWTEIEEAHQVMKSNKNHGKIVVSIP